MSGQHAPRDVLGCVLAIGIPLLFLGLVAGMARTTDTATPDAGAVVKVTVPPLDTPVPATV